MNYSRDMAILRHAWLDTGYEINLPDSAVPELSQLGEQWSSKSKFHCAHHEHNDLWEIHCQLNGSIEWVINGNPNRLDPGDCYLLAPGVKHAYTDCFTDRFHFYYAIFDLHALVRHRHIVDLIPNAADTLADARPYYISNKTQNLINILGGLNYEVCRKGQYRSIGIRTSLFQLTVECLRIISNERPEYINGFELTPPINRVKELLEKEMEKEWTIDELAKIAGYSASHFMMEFKKQIGMSPVRYRINMKVYESMRMLENPEMRITEIAHPLGFQSSQYFATTFKEHTGMTPTEYRSSYSNSSFKKQNL